MSGGRPRTFCFDLDGTLCTNTWGDYESARPFPWAVERVRALARAGNRILVFTARGGTTGIDWREVTERQLREWGVPYDELILGKPAADVYVDDRTVHVDAWRYGDASRVGAADSLPVLPPPRSTTVVEVGRTFGHRPFRLADHARRVLAAAAGCGIAAAHPVAAIVEAVESAIEPSRDLLAADDDVVFTIGLAGPPHAGYLDTVEDGLAADLTIGCRLLSQVASGLPRFLRAGGVAATATGEAVEDLWPLGLDGSGALRDLFGGDVVAVRGRRVQASADDAGVALVQTLELAARLGLEVDGTPPSAADALGADELLLVGCPFCVLPVSSVDAEPVGTGAPGAVARDLLLGWSELTGTDVGAQWR